ncbi:MAG: (Fe-S)-binding protein [Chloroflexi bacterium]|nr:(Fe-S)-binding protein [Chloroflexota bacterium]
MSLERLEALRRDMKKCVRCSLCKLVPLPTIQQTRFTSACPPVDEYHFHAYSGGGMQIMALALLDGRIEVDRDLAQIVSACTTCGLCDVSCKFIMAAERQDVIMALKEHIAESGFGAAPKAEDKPALPHWAHGLKLKILPASKSDVLLFIGAGAHHDPQHAATAHRLAELLQHARVDFGILEDEPESGIETYWTGQRQAFAEQAQGVVERLDNAGSHTIIALCGEDLGMLRAKYPRYSRAPQAKVLHASEFLLPLIQTGRLRLTHPIKQCATYHDPCYLGRQSEPPLAWQGEERQTQGVMRYFTPPKPINYGVNGVFDAPRQVLRAVPGLQFVEMHRIREYAYCCGGGGGVPDAHPNVARSASIQRVDEARAVGAEMLVTACQHCRHNLTRWQDGTSTPVIDLVDLVYAAAGLG